MSAELKEKLVALEAKLPAMFGITCTSCGKVMKTNRKTFLHRVEAVNGDTALLMKQYHCKACRKAKGVDFLGNVKTKKNSVRVIGLEDIA